MCVKHISNVNTQQIQINTNSYEELECLKINMKINFDLLKMHVTLFEHLQSK